MTQRATTRTGEKARALLEELQGKAPADTTNKTQTQKPKPKPKPKAPPQRVEPGWIHHAISEAILKRLQSQTEDAIGAPLEVGKLPETNDLIEMATGDNPAEDGREPEELLARVVAHIFYRIPGARKIEKRLEGKELRSGILSDLSALGMQLWRRNQHLGPVIVERAKAARATQKVAKPAGTRATPTHRGQDCVLDEATGFCVTHQVRHMTLVSEGGVNGA